MRKKYLVLLLVTLVIALTGCGKKKYVAPPPAPYGPSNLTASAGSPINLTWNDNSTNENGFYVYRRTTDDYARVAIMEVNATSYNDTALSPETTYWYKVTAYNDGGESPPSNEVSATTPAEPPPPPEPLEPPTNVEATTVSYKQINLSWRDNSDDEDNFRISCDSGLGDGHNEFLVRLPANTTQYEHYNLQPMRHYRYFVMVERSGEYAASERFGATTPCPVTAFLWEAWPKTDENGNWIDNLVGVTLSISSEASEPCRVELIVFVTDWPYPGEVIGSTKETFEVEAFGGGIHYLEVVVSRQSIKVYGSAEITDVEIYY